MAKDTNRLLLDKIIPMDASIGTLRNEVEEMTHRLQSIESQLADMQQGERIAALAARLALVEEQVREIGSTLRRCMEEQP